MAIFSFETSMSKKTIADSMESQWGVDSVALAIVSHRHIDHYGGMDDVLRKFPIGQLVMNMRTVPTSNITTPFWITFKYSK